MPAERRPLLAIGIDAAEGRLVHRLASEGRLPAIERIVRSGRSGIVQSPAALGSGAVWPTFITGDGPERHGLFGEYAWDPQAMALRRPSFEHLAPFWADAAEGGRRVLVIDVPFAPVIRRASVVEVADWGAHDWLGGSRVVEPASVEAAIADLLAVPHPLVAGPVDSTGPRDVEGLRHVVRACVAGVRQRGELARRLLTDVRPDLSIVVFTEAHRASHLLWHTLDRTHPAWSEDAAPLPADVMNGLVDVFMAIDEAIGRLVEAHGEHAPRLVFALHGMQPARGIPALLDDVLRSWGYAVERRWWQRGLPEQASVLAQGAKRRLPTWVKQAYYARVPKAVTMQLAQPSVPVRAWDWSRTRAVSLPTDQHGWIRLNLEGREARGTVPAAAYDEVCMELEQRLLTLASPEGRLVNRVVRTALDLGRPPRLLPDLVVHWSPLTWRPTLRVVHPPLTSTAIGLKFVGQHDEQGFFVAAGKGVDEWPDVVTADSLGRRLLDAVGVKRTAGDGPRPLHPHPLT